MTISSVSRRLFLQLLAAASADASTRPFSRSVPSASLRPKEILRLARSENFGIRANGDALTSGSFYRAATERASELSFDISNNQIAASFTSLGSLRRACICSGVDPLPPEKIKGGVYSEKRLLYGGPWTLQAANETRELSRESVEVALLENLLPLFSWTAADLDIHQLVFAPVDATRPARSPRAILQIVVIENKGDLAQTVKLAHSSEKSPASSASIEPHDSGSGQAANAQLRQALARFVRLDREEQSNEPWSLRIGPHSVGTIAAAWLLGETEGELRETVVGLRNKPIESWLEDTLVTRRSAYGNLSVPQSTVIAESVVRFSELSRQSALRAEDGTFCGGFLGSDVDTTPINWPRDAYYSMLAMSLFDPGLCADSIPYFLRWGRSPQTTGAGRARFPGAMRVSQSLSNSVSGLTMAGAYYRATGDRGFFTARPQILDQARTIFDEVLASRRGETMLFPSLYFSDGEARGDYHTGSNVAAWFALTGMAQVASGAYRNDNLAQEWSSIAQKVREAIDTHCVGDGPSGKRFFEGANANGTFVEGHDGEESETTLMPFYGFCESDDSRLLNHAALAMTTANPLYSPELDAIWWYNSEWRSATFPGWTTAMAGARDELQLQDRIERIRSLTDLDGSVWWWPYPYGSKDRAFPKRADGARKCGWAAAVYLCRLMNDVCGISVDARSRSLRFAPFTPWSSFRWDRAKVGATMFDFEYEREGTAISASVTNRNHAAYTASVLLTPQQDASIRDLRVSGGSIREQERVHRWGREALQVRLDVAPGARVKVTGILN